MHDSIRRHFASFLKAVQKSSLPDDRKEFFAASIDRLPPMYATYRDTNDSRHGDEITRVVQTMLKALEGCPEGREIDGEFRTGLHALHEEFGVPILRLKSLPAPRKPTKASKSRTA